ncbi:MAG: metal-dependent hydrolase [Sulfuritalea sp.]|nr:metal-dependent hydrolase [Sulfuritalea sp.]
MMAVTHVALGAVAGIGWAALAEGALLPAVVASIAGSLLPDIDHPKSWLGRRLPFVSWPLAAVVGHRGITHSLLATVACLALLWEAGHTAVAAPAALGYLSHLAADWCTHGGVPLLWPSLKHYHAPVTVRTGSIADLSLAAVLWLGAGWYLAVPH